MLPSIYLLIRMNIVALNNVNIDILGQMEWFHLLNEVLATTLIVPLYSILKPQYKRNTHNGIAFVISMFIYTLFTIFMSLHVGTITKYMEAEYASEYLLLQSFSMLISFISTFMIMLFTLNDDYKTIEIPIIIKLILFVGIQIFLDNFIYAIMICKMVNAVSESGNYWIANNFIWGWLLVPVSYMAEIIKKNSLKKLNFKNT